MTMDQARKFQYELEVIAQRTLRKAQAEIEKEAKDRGFKSVDALVRANKQAARKAVVESVCGGDEDLYKMAFKEG
jgi:3-hydroxyisobutyrate dehydrogenase-like beta-hydroxyacid dehydrogenase